MNNQWNQIKANEKKCKNLCLLWEQWSTNSSIHGTVLFANNKKNALNMFVLLLSLSCSYNNTILVQYVPVLLLNNCIIAFHAFYCCLGREGGRCISLAFEFSLFRYFLQFYNSLFCVRVNPVSYDIRMTHVSTMFHIFFFSVPLPSEH